MLPGAESTPVDSTVVDAYWQCTAQGQLFNTSAGDACHNVLEEFAEATGCGEGTTCWRERAWRRNPSESARALQCRSISTAGGPFECVAERITTPCPDWPPLGRGAASADEPDEFGVGAEQPVGGGAAEAPRVGEQVDAPASVSDAGVPAPAPVATVGVAESVSGAGRVGTKVAAVWGAVGACAVAAGV